jgi:hypothetical protein
MRLRDGIMELMVCLVLIGLPVVGVVSVFVTGLQRDIDGLLLILVCVLMFSIFSTLLFVLAKQEGWFGHLSRPRRQRGGWQRAPVLDHLTITSAPSQFRR